jgi:curved DNA-binding protein CbpA
MDINRFFEILELEPGATLDEAKQAYKDIVNVWHPDRFSDNPRLRRKAEEKLKEANRAYEMVKSFLSSRDMPGQEPASKAQREARDRTEVAVEVATRIILTLCSHLYSTLRSLIPPQDQRADETEKDKGGSEGPNLRQGHSTGRPRGRGKTSAEGRKRGATRLI